MKFLRCACYLALCGALGFAAGRALPHRWIKEDHGLFRSFASEKSGKVYEKLKVKSWQNKLPDMSRILPFAMPAKNLAGNYAARLDEMIKETCVAELTHIAVAAAGFRCIRIWPGWGGAAIAAFNLLFLNLPFIIIQRYNRPRLKKLREKQLLRTSDGMVGSV